MRFCMYLRPLQVAGGGQVAQGGAQQLLCIQPWGWAGCLLAALYAINMRADGQLLGGRGTQVARAAGHLLTTASGMPVPHSVRISLPNLSNCCWMMVLQKRAQWAPHLSSLSPPPGQLYTACWPARGASSHTCPCTTPPSHSNDANRRSRCSFCSKPSCIRSSDNTEPCAPADASLQESHVLCEQRATDQQHALPRYQPRFQAEGARHAAAAARGGGKVSKGKGRV